jgi:hypothetical protein
MNQNKKQQGLLIWLIFVSVLSILAILILAGIFLFSYIIVAGANREISMFASGVADTLILVFLLFSGLLITLQTITWISWKKDNKKIALTLSLVIFGLFVLPITVMVFYFFI